MTVQFDIRTAPFSRWNVENALDEPAHGYFARLVAAEGHSSVTRYADGIDVNTRHTNPETLLDVLLKLPLAEGRKARLLNATPQRRGDGVWLAGQRLNHSDLSFSSRRWCPGCLHESGHHRTWWDITAIQTCPFHGVDLVEHDKNAEAVRWWWPEMSVSPGGDVLHSPIGRTGDDRSFSGYIVGRLGFGPYVPAPLLDRCDLSAAISVCQMLGTLLSLPWTDNLPGNPEMFGEAGFRAIGGSAVALVEALRAWIRINVPKEIVRRGYTIVFGQANKRRQALSDPELSNLLKKAFRKALALEARGVCDPLTNDDFLDDEIGLTALAQRIGISRKGISAVADAIGLLPEREWYRAPVKFDPSEADTIEFHCRRMATRVEAAASLGLVSQDIQHLVDAGYLREFRNVSIEGPSGARFLQSDIQVVLDRLIELLTVDSNCTSLGLFAFAKGMKIERGDGAADILRGRLKIVAGDRSRAGFRAIRIVTAEADPSLPPSSRTPSKTIKRLPNQMSLAEAEIELNITRQTLWALVQEKHLSLQEQNGARWLDRAEVVVFGRDHRNAREFLTYIEGSLDDLKQTMTDNNIRALLSPHPKSKGHSVNVIYRYSDLRKVLRFRRDPTRITTRSFQNFWDKARAMTSERPPFLYLPSTLSLDGQAISNAKRTLTFMVVFNEDTGILAFEGRRLANGLSFEIAISNPQSLEKLEEALVTIASLV